MSVIVAGMWDLGWNTPIKEVDLWEYPLREYGVDEYYMCPISGIDHPVKERKDIQSILDEHPTHTVIFCDERATVTLKEFSHPKKALYVFGRANFSPFLSIKRDQDLSLKIESVSDGGMLWGHQAAAIILHDRLIKSRIPAK